MPGKRTPADPGEVTQVQDADPRQAGVQQDRPTGGGQWQHGEAPPENAYREKPNRNQG